MKLGEMKNYVVYYDNKGIVCKMNVSATNHFEAEKIAKKNLDGYHEILSVQNA